MAFSKEIKLGEFGALTLSESAGVASMAVSIGESVGGGQAAGVVKTSASVQVEIGAQQAADLAIALLEAKFPSMKGILDGAKAALDAELAKL